MQTRENLTTFEQKVQELLYSQYILAEKKIAGVLQAVASSPLLVGMFEIVLKKFDYLGAKQKFFVTERNADGEYRGRFVCPEKDTELLPLAFCLLMDLDSGKISLSEFLGCYFYENGSFADGYEAFLNRLVRPFGERTCALAREAIRQAESGENVEETATETPQETPTEPIETTRKKRVVYEGKIVNVRSDDVLLPSGKTAKREVVMHPGGAAIVVMDSDDRILLVKQYRYAVGETLYEIPAGKLDKGEYPLQAAKRELLEETGLVAENLTPLGFVYSSCGFTDERIYLYLCRDFTVGEACPDEDESVTTVWMSVKEVLQKIEDGEIPDAKTQIGVFRAIQR